MGKSMALGMGRGAGAMIALALLLLAARSPAANPVAGVSRVAQAATVLQGSAQPDTVLAPDGSDQPLLYQYGSAVAISGDLAVVGAPWTIGSERGTAFVYRRVNDSWSLQAQLEAPDGHTYDYFGTAVSISGTTVVVTSERHGPGGDPNQDLDSRPGAAYVFVQSGETWSLQAELADDSLNNYSRFGESVSLDGDTLAVGAWGAEAVYVYVRAGTSWSQQAKIIPGDNQGDDSFARSVALSGDTLAVGAPHHNVYHPTEHVLNMDEGAVYAFVRNGTSWTQQAELIAVDGFGFNYLGWSVAISLDTIIAGSWGATLGGNSMRGAALVWIRSGSEWSEQATLAASNAAAGDEFGISVALSGDHALVGAWAHDVDANADQGAAYFYVRNGSNWSEQKIYTVAAGKAHDWLGFSSALSPDTALVGAIQETQVNGLFPSDGAVHVLIDASESWSEQGRLIEGETASNDRFGTAVAASLGTIVVGVPFDSTIASAAGSAYVFVDNAGQWLKQALLAGDDLAANDRFGSSVAIDGDTAAVGSPQRLRDGVLEPSSVYVFVRSGSDWSQQARLTAPDGGPFDYFGTTVSISGDTIVVGAPNHTTAPELRPGAVYVYVRSGVTWTFQAELSASSPFTGPPLETFGGAVAVSGDTLVASAVAGFNSPNPNPGSALVFVRSGGLWTLQQEVFAGDGAATDQFGTALALAGDTLLVGAPGRTGGPAESPATRAAYVFDRAATSWSLSAKLYSDAADDQFGGAVALAGDTAVVGAYADFRSGLMARGAAHVWVRDTGGWGAQAQLARRGLAPGDAYGFAVATDGRYVAAGAPDVRGTGMGAYEGRVYVIDSGAGEPTSTAIVPDARAPIAPGTTSVVVNVSGQSGTPAGSVTISGSNGAACIASLAPAGPGSASGSCDLAFGQPGLYWLDAAFAGSESFRASSGAGLQPVQGSADLAIAISNNSDFLHGGGNTTYQIVVTNLGSTTAFSAEVDDVLPAGLSNGSWTCTAIDGGVCPASGSGDLSALVTLPVGAEAHFVLSADVSSASESPIIDTATVSPSVPGTDPVLGNNSASDGPDQRGIFRDGFEG